MRGDGGVGGGGTQCLPQLHVASVEDEEGPEHGHHVEDDITQEGAGCHREGLDQCHAAGNHRGHEDACPCGGEECMNKF